MRQQSVTFSDSDAETPPTIDRAVIICENSLTLLAKQVKDGVDAIQLGMLLNISNTTIINYVLGICGKYGLRDAGEREIYQLSKSVLFNWYRSKENNKPKEKVTLLTTALADCNLEKLAGVVMENYNNHTEITEDQFNKPEPEPEEVN